jgi:prolipoprotein diacylglyceryltransferase
VLSFLFILIIGYIGAFFGGQVYGRETSFGIEILYKNPFTPVPYQVPVFPLPIVYTLMSFFIFSAMYMLSLFIHIKGYIGYMGLILFSAMILIFEFFSGKQDIVSIYSVFNLPQIYALILAVWS